MTWGTDGSANRIKNTYIKGYLDVSGGPLIIQKTSSLQIIKHDADEPILEFKSEYFTVTTTSAVDVSYSALAALGQLGISYENSTAEVTGKIKYITSGGSIDLSTAYTSIGNDDERCKLNVYGNIKGHYGLEVDGDVSFNNHLYVNNDLTLNDNLFVGKNSFFTLDVSMNRNLDIGSGSNSVAINKDISSGIAFDVSGLTILRNTLNVVSDASLNGNTKLGLGSNSIYINKDISSGIAFDVSGLTILRNTLNVVSDASLNGNTKLGLGSNSIYINKDISSGIALDVSGLTILRRTLNVVSDASLNGNTKLGLGSNSIYINKDISSGIAFDVSGLTILRNTLNVVSDASLNGNTKLGLGSNSIYINKDISSGIALDVSGLTILRRTLNVVSDASLNGNTKLGLGSNSIYINKDISSGIALDVSGLTILRNTLNVVSDASLNGNTKLGLGSNSIYINKDISSGIALDVSGLTILRNTLNVVSDASLNGNTKLGLGSNSIYINKDISSGIAFDVSGLTILRNTLNVVSDASLNGNTKLGLGSNSIYINKDISSGIAFDVSGLTILRNTLNVVSDASLNGNTKLGLGSNSIYINKDISSGIALDVSGLTILRRTLNVVSDASLNGNTKLGLGSNSIYINKDISSGIAFDVSGLTILRNTLNVVSDASLNGNTKLGLGSNSIYINKDISSGIAFDVSGLTILRNTLNVVSDASLNGNTKLGLGSNSIYINKDISSGFAFDVSGLTILRNTLNVVSDASLNGNTKLGLGSNSIYINKDISSGIAFDVSGLTILRNTLNVVSDASLNGNTKLGLGSNSIYINKDISSGFAFDVSGLTILRNTLNVVSDASLNGNTKLGLGSNSIYINKDISSGIALDVSGLTILRNTLNVVSDASLNGNTKLGLGSNSIYINKDISSGIALDVSGLTILRNTLNVVSDASLNGNTKLGLGSNSIYINKDISSGIALDVSGLTILRRTLNVVSDASLNGNTKLGLGSNSIYINKDISSGIALDVSGLTILRRTLNVVSDASLNGNTKLGLGSNSIYINKDISSGIAFDVSGLTILRNTLNVVSDASLNGNTKLGLGSNSIYINKDISSGIAFDVSGLTILRNTLNVVSDASLNGNTKLGLGSNSIYINKDISSGIALDVSGVTILRNTLNVVSDASLNGNTKLGLGSNSIYINKDISSGIALDVSGVTQIRGNLDVAGVFTVNGAPVSGGGGTLTGNVQVGSNNGFVTINKPYFFADPSLVIYYNFDTSINSGTGIKNNASETSTYDGSFNVITAPSTSGMIDTSLFYNGKQNNTSLASFKNSPGVDNTGIRIGSGAVPVSSFMTFSFWLYKKTRPIVQGDFDRVFHFTDSTSVSASENNTIALDISAGGNIFPVITKGTAPLITPSLPIFSYDLCTSAWNHVVWTINGTNSSIYINGSISQNDTLSENITLNTSTQRQRGVIAYTYTSATGATRDFSGNLDDFRYYKDKALSYMEIYQLYNNSFYTLDICGGFLSNGPSVIYEPIGSVATANSGSLTLMHGDAGGSSSIMFKSNNGQGDYAYIEYDENIGITLPYLKFDFSANLSNNIPSTGSFTSYNLEKLYADASINAVTIASVGGTIPTQLSSLTPAPYCIAFNQYNITEANTNRISVLWFGSNTNFINPFGSGFTFSAWIRPTTVSATNCRFHIASFVDYNRYNENAGRFIQIYIEGSSSNGNHQKIVVLINNDVINYSSTSSTLTANMWYHYTFTFDNGTSTGYHYLDGVLNNTVLNSGYAGKTLTANSVNFALALRWGYNYGDIGEKGFNGYMCYLNTFNYALSASDIAYLYNYPGYSQTTLDRGLMTIGVESESGVVFNDRISLWPSGGTGFVGVNTKTPTTTLDVSGQMRIYEGVGTAANPGSGSLTLEHANAGGKSSLVFKGANGTTGDYAYVQYEDALNQVQSLLQYNFSSNTPSSFTGTSSPVVYTTLASTGTSSSTIGFGDWDNSFAWFDFSNYGNDISLNGFRPAYCISFNQTNLIRTNTSKINFLVNITPLNFSSFTFSAWIRPGTITPPSGQAVRWMIANLNNNSSDGVIDIWIESNTSRIYVLLGDDESDFIYTSTFLVVNTWYHLVFTFDGINKTGNIYINGILNTVVAGTTGLTGKTLKPNSNLVIGMKYGFNTGIGTNTSYQGGIDHYKGFRGQMAFLNVFDVPLNASEVSYLYNNPSYNPTATSDRGLLTIGIENETGYINSDRIALWPGAGKGFVGVNTRIPEYTLDVSGTLNTNADAVINSMQLGRGAGNGISNIAFGYQALHSNTTGYQNIAIGFQALTNHKSGFDNIALGYKALLNNIGTSDGYGVSNIGLGTYALANCATGGNNTGVGFGSLSRLTNSFHNVGIGRYAGAGNSDSSYNFQGNANTFLGSYTGMNGTFANSTAVGTGAIITASNQIKLGRNNEHVRCGDNLLLKGDGTNCYIRNTVVGSVLNFGTDIYDYMNISASGLTVNKATGTLLTLKNTAAIATGSEVNIDFLTAYNGFSMARISALDITPMVDGQVGGFSTRLRFSLGGTSFTEYMSLDYTGLKVTGNGTFTGMRINGNNSTAASNAPDFKEGESYNNHNLVLVSTKTPDATKTLYSMALGVDYASGFGYINAAGNSVLQPLRIQSRGGAVGIGEGSPSASYALDVFGNVQATGYNATSDYRIKKNVVPLNLTFNVDLLNPVSYYLKDDKDARLNIGFIAHEVQEVYPYLVSGVKDGSFNQSINYNGFIGILTKEIQELKKKVLDQEARIVEQEAKALAKAAEQEARIAEQEARIQALEKMMLDLINK
jgi:hypothetical protein